MASLNRNIDSVTVVRFLKENIGEVGAKIQYGVLSGKVDVLSSLPVSFIIAIATTIIPMVSSLNAQKNGKELNRIIKTYLLFTILLVLPCCFGMIAFSDQILVLLFKSNSGSWLLKISAISMIFIALEQITNSVLQGVGKVFIPTISIFIGVIAKIILNINLIKLPIIYPIGGVSGACVATMVCHLIAFSISFNVMKKYTKVKLNFFKYILKPVIASCIMSTALYYSYFFLKGIFIENIAIILAIVIAGLMYILSVIALRILNKDELGFIPFIPNFRKK